MKWTSVKLHDICRAKQWKTISISNLKESGFPVYGANGQIGFYDKYTHEKSTLLITCRGATCGTINICEPYSYVTGNSMALDDLDETRANQKYLYHYLRKRRLDDVISGSAQPQITRDGLKKVEIPLPPIAEQKRIAAILDKAEELRGLRRKALGELDAIVQSIFLEMFGDPEMNPKGWKVLLLADLVSEFRYGSSNKSQLYGKPALRIPNVIGGTLDLSDLKLVPVDDSELERLRMQNGDILFVRTNGNPDFVGRCAVFNHCLIADTGFAEDEFIFASYLIRARLGSQAVVPLFLREFLLGAAGRRELRSRCKTSAGQFNINIPSLGSICVPLPPVSLQEEFARRVEAIEQLKTTHHESLTQLDALFASLQHRAFRGEL